MGSVAGRCWGLQDKCRRGRPTTRDTLLATHTAAAELRARLDRFGTQAGAVDVDDDDDDGDYAASTFPVEEDWQRCRFVVLSCLCAGRVKYSYGYDSRR